MADLAARCGVPNLPPWALCSLTASCEDFSVRLRIEIPVPEEVFEHFTQSRAALGIDVLVDPTTGKPF
jgi:hypothetical protein